MDNYERFGPARQVILFTSPLARKWAINQDSDEAAITVLTHIIVIPSVRISRMVAVISGNKGPAFPG
jgi:hypothetical protein